MASWFSERNSLGRHVEGIDRDAVRRRWQLTARETEVVLGVLRDASEAQIAEDLGIARNTVHTYIARIYRALGVRSRVQLVTRVLLDGGAKGNWKDVGP